VDISPYLPLIWQIMNNSPLPKILLGILAIISIWSLILCWSYFKAVREARDLQLQMNAMNYKQQVFASLINESVEYSKKNAAIEPILRPILGQPAPAAAPASAPKASSK